MEILLVQQHTHPVWGCSFSSKVFAAGVGDLLLLDCQVVQCPVEPCQVEAYMPAVPVLESDRPDHSDNSIPRRGQCTTFCMCLSVLCKQSLHFWRSESKLGRFLHFPLATRNGSKGDGGSLLHGVLRCLQNLTCCPPLGMLLHGDIKVQKNCNTLYIELPLKTA